MAFSWQIKSQDETGKEGIGSGQRWHFRPYGDSPHRHRLMHNKMRKQLANARQFDFW
jgi:hypothetical protein